MDSGASISVLNLPTYTILSGKFLHCSSQILPPPSKTITVANKSQVPILFNINLTCQTSINNDSHTFIIPYAVTNIKYSILGTQRDVENLTLLFKDTPNARTHSSPFAAHKEKDYPFFSCIYNINVSKKIFFQQKSSNAVHFPIKISSFLSFKTTEIEPILPSTPHTYFHKRLNSTFSFLHFHDPTKTTLTPSSCSLVIQNITNHSATLPFGCIGYIEIPATLGLPSAYHVHDINSLVHCVFNSYYPTVVEPMPPSRSTSPPINLSSSSFELHNLQPTQILQHSFPIPPYSKQTLSFLIKFKFHYSDITNEDYLKDCQILVKYQSCYATQRSDVGKLPLVYD